MSAEFDKLHPALQHHIVNSLGWSELRPLQASTITPLLADEHAILLAPTAGGKTEAAMFPVFSRMLSEQWTGTSVLYICPIKALLNNLEHRLSYYAGLIGRRVGIWHGDVKASTKNAIIKEPPDILLTTPESIEVMLVSRRIDHQLFFQQLKTLIVDEVHAFAGDDRGWHLMYLLERLQSITSTEIQRIGLSATVGNPDGLCAWLTSGCERPARVINPPAEQTAEPEVEVDWVGSIDNAALVIARLHKGEKRLVFCDSRRRVEDLTFALRAREITTFVSHSSISLEERAAAEKAFSEGQDCVIVATSTLELGIDVGDLDRVIQIDAPSTVASFLQRIGRTGRRKGTSRNCLFLATRHDAFLHTIALLKLWNDGYVEPVEPPDLPFHIFAQQIMALTLQESGIGTTNWTQFLTFTPGLRQAEQHRQSIVQHMIETEVLHSDQGIIGMGRKGEKDFGRKNFMELFSVFTSPPLIKVLFGRQEIGEVDQTTFFSGGVGTTLILAGRAWQTVAIDWKLRTAQVEPTNEKGSTKWVSPGVAVNYEMCQSVLNVLTEDTNPVRLSQRARDQIEDLRNEYDWVETDATLIIHTGTTTQWWTFAGLHFNQAAASALQDCADKVSANNLSVEFSGNNDPENIYRLITARIINNESTLAPPIDSDFIEELKFSECLPPKLQAVVLKQRYSVDYECENISRKSIRVVRINPEL